jgi:hypothetical protein
MFVRSTPLCFIRLVFYQKEILTKALHEGEVIAPPPTLSILMYAQETAQRMIGTRLWVVTCTSRSTEATHWPHASRASRAPRFTPTFIELDWLHQLQTVPFARPFVDMLYSIRADSIFSSPITTRVSISISTFNGVYTIEPTTHSSIGGRPHNCGSVAW